MTTEAQAIPRPKHGPDDVFTDGPNAGRRMASVGWITEGPEAGRWVVPSDAFREPVPGQKIEFGQRLSEGVLKKMDEAVKRRLAELQANRRRRVK